jgi:hypothetical protein
MPPRSDAGVIQGITGAGTQDYERESPYARAQAISSGMEAAGVARRHTELWVLQDRVPAGKGQVYCWAGWGDKYNEAAIDSAGGW